jgi:phosphatidate cytidylyltransferase
MTESGTSESDRRRLWSDLGPRVGSALVLLAVTVLALVLGGIWFALLVGAVFAGAFREWEMMITGQRVEASGFVLIGLVALVAVIYPISGLMGSGVIAALGIVVALILPGADRIWRGAGVAYFSLVIIAVLLLRGNSQLGIGAGVFMAASVWMTDSAAFFAGRQIGGVKLSPDISPSKTWSGALGGLAMGTLAGGIVWWFASPSAWWIGLILAAILSVTGQLGDLAESAIKRHFRIKDSSDIIPGHGGLMDRLDSLTTAVLVLSAIGVLRAGLDNVASGILVW